MMRNVALVVILIVATTDAANPGKKRMRDEPSEDSDGDSDVDKDEPVAAPLRRARKSAATGPVTKGRRIVRSKQAPPAASGAGSSGAGSSGGGGWGIVPQRKTAKEADKKVKANVKSEEEPENTYDPESSTEAETDTDTEDEEGGITVTMLEAGGGLIMLADLGLGDGPAPVEFQAVDTTGDGEPDAFIANLNGVGWNALVSPGDEGAMVQGAVPMTNTDGELDAMVIDTTGDNTVTYVHIYDTFDVAIPLADAAAYFAGLDINITPPEGITDFVYLMGIFEAIFDPDNPDFESHLHLFAVKKGWQFLGWAAVILGGRFNENTDKMKKEKPRADTELYGDLFDAINAFLSGDITFEAFVQWVIDKRAPIYDLGRRKLQDHGPSSSSESDESSSSSSSSSESDDDDDDDDHVAPATPATPTYDGDASDASDEYDESWLPEPEPDDDVATNCCAGTSNDNPTELDDSDDDGYLLGGVPKKPRSGKERM